MKLKLSLNIVFFLVVIAILAIVGFSFLATYNIFKDFGSDYKVVFQRLNTNIYALIIISALTAISGVIIFRGLMSKILKLIEELNSFTQNVIQGRHDVKFDVKGSDELKLLAANINRIADSYNEKIVVLESAMAKRQKAVRELAILNELMGFVTSELKFEVILKNFVNRTKDLIKSGYCAAIIFVPEVFTPKVFVTNEGIQDPSSIQLNPEGSFKETFKNLVPLRLSAQQQNVTGDPQGYIKIPELNLEVKDLLALPLISSGKLSGLLLLANKLDGPFNQEDEDLLMDFTFQAFQTIAMHEEITNLAVTDGLTGLNNHRHLQERLKDDVELAKRYGKNISFLILDVDHFKTFNDIYGHQTGDIVLKTIASIMREQIRSTDFPARYGGEEFAVIMPETNYDGAKNLAERLRKKIAETPLLLPDDDKALITVSIGFASIPENTSDKDELVEMADKALYFAKEHGRNLSSGYKDVSGDRVHEYDKTAEHFETEPLTIENLADLVDSKTPYTKGHSMEVAKLAVLLANGVELKESDIESLKIASVLHDVGIINVPSRILNKPGELTDEEKKIIKAHPLLAEIILKKHPYMESVLPIILYHHERFDGNGYPLGIAGEDIPLGARILAIAEAFHAMISPRPYKKRLTVEEAFGELRGKAGSQFDPQLVEAFINVLKTQNYN